MFNNVKNLFSEIFYSIKNINFKDKIKNVKDNIDEVKYKVNNLFETNLNNGLTHYHDGHYQDALLRFKVMNYMWKNNATVQYNLGRAYFGLKKKEKAKECFEKALNLQPTEEEKIFIQFFLKKIDDIENIVFVPEDLKKETYNWVINSFINDHEIHQKEIKKVFDLYNRYIGSIVVSNGEENVSLLELGCFTGYHGSLIRSEFKKIKLDGVDISEKMANRCKELKVKIVDNQEIQVYDNVFQKEMHLFLNENIVSFLNENSEKKTELEKQIEQDLEYENLKNSDLFKGKLYDMIFSFGSFADFGELSVVIKLAEMNLNESGVLIFIVPKSLNGGIQFSIYQDYFLYSKEYVENILKETKLQVVDFIEYNRYNDDDFNMMFILRRGA
jgi:predicted TPR repeat methyltransferase